MAHTIQLTIPHQEHLVAALIHSFDSKRRVVFQDHDKIPQTQEQYHSACVKLTGVVKCGTKQKNIFTWIIDQLEHSPDILHTQFIQDAITICRYAATNRYQEFCRTLPQL